MNPLSHFMVAQLQWTEAVSLGNARPFRGQDVMIVLGVVTAVALVSLFWAISIRKPHRRGHSRRRHSHHSSGVPAATPDGSSEEASFLGHHKRRRRRRREHRPRNPTLAETGGLPPVRTEEPPQQLL
jgi:hypothetical protein